jgi:hypothetical protein
VGDRVEINTEGWEIMRMIGELVEGKVVDQQRGERAATDASELQGVGGVGLVVDYGDEKAFDNSFRVSTGFLLFDFSRLRELMRSNYRPSEDTRSYTSLTTRVAPI